MGTETTRVSSYAQFEGYKDSAGTMYPYASAVNNLVTGLTTAVNASSLVNLVSGLTTAVNASSLVNLVSGLVTGVKASALNDIISGVTVSAGQINFATGYPASAAYAASATTAQGAASASYAASAGTLSGVTVTAATLNKLQYAASSHKIAYGSAVMAAGSSIVSMADNGITTCAFFLATPQNSCIMSVTFTSTSATIVMASGAGVVTAGVAHWMAVND